MLQSTICVSRVAGVRHLDQIRCIRLSFIGEYFSNVQRKHTSKMKRTTTTTTTTTMMMMMMMMMDDDIIS